MTTTQTRDEAVEALCKAIGAPSKNVHDITIRFNNEVRIGYMTDKFRGVQYKWFKDWVKPND